MIFVSGLALPIAQGCGGDDASIGANPGSDGGGDESTSTPPGDSSTPTDSSTNPDSTSADPFCSALASYDTRCSLTDACDVAKSASCSTDEGFLSAGAIAAYTACAAQDPCPGASVGTDGGLKAYDECVAAHFGTPTTEETAIVGDYCTRCGGGAADCDTGPVARSLVVYDDALLTEIQATCLTRDGGPDDGGLGVGTKCGEFAKCARDIVASHDPPPAACNDN
jgi:hypothetical protein